MDDQILENNMDVKSQKNERMSLVSFDKNMESNKLMTENETLQRSKSLDNKNSIIQIEGCGMMPY